MIAERMKLIVENSGESQSTIAERLGVSQPRLNQYLNGKREADQAFITRFCRYFHTTPNSLFEFGAEELSEDALNLFANIIEKVEVWSLNRKVFYEPADKAELIKLIFKKVFDLPETQRNAKIIDFMEVYESFKKAN